MKLLDHTLRTIFSPARGGRFPITLAAAVGLAILPVSALAGGDAPTDCLPPGGSEYTAQFHQLYAAGLIDLRDPIHDRFTMCDPPPPLPGMQTVHSFGSRVRCNISSDGGLTYQPHEMPGQVTARVMNSGPDGTGGTLYDTEMLQLDISGGTLPPGVLIRESPSRPSLGQTRIDPSGGGFHIDSFFDIFTDLSLDGGQTWYPSEGPPGHMTMDIPVPTPTRTSTWGSLKLLYR